ncbi:unnamed protein product [Camellia sinensis]
MIHLRGFGTLRLLQSELGDSSRIAILKFDFEHSSVIYLRGFGTLRLLRSKVSSLIVSMPQNDLMKYFREDLRSRNNRTRIECVDLVGFLIDNHGAEIVGQLKSLQLVASLTAERDGEIRKAALNTLATGYKIFGDDIWRYVGKLTKDQRSVLDVDLNGRPETWTKGMRENLEKQGLFLGVLLGKMGDAIVSWVKKKTGPGISYEAQRYRVGAPLEEDLGSWGIIFFQQVPDAIFTSFSWKGGEPMKRPKRIVDVGCEIGGSSRYLARKYEAHCQGITLSPIQAQMAEGLVASQGLANKDCDNLLGKFTRTLGEKLLADMRGMVARDEHRFRRQIAFYGKLSLLRAITCGYLILVIVLAFLGKIAGTLVVAMYYQMPFYEAFTLGLLMTAKDLVEMIVLNVGREQQVLDDRAFAIMIIVAVAMTAIITPIVTTIYKPSKRFAPYKQRSIQILKPEAELRVLVCIHTPRNVPTIIKLLEASHPTKNSPFCIYVLHLVELTGRASSMLIVHSTQGSGSPALNWTQAQSNQIINAFEKFKQRVTCVSVNPLTAISPYTMMHEDICIAIPGLPLLYSDPDMCLWMFVIEDKHVAFIIIPFHKQQTVDGGMQVANAAFRSINHNVLANAPCSVGILVDRGLTGLTRLGASNQVSHQVVVMFFGGADDREALSYAWRMSEHPGISLTVIRFIAGDNAIDPTRVETSAEPNSPTTLTVVTDSDRDK